MVEINQVRLLPESAGGGGMGMMGGDMDMDMGMGDMDMDMGRVAWAWGAWAWGWAWAWRRPSQSMKRPLDMSVEIYGIIYIYNPPDRVKLGSGAGQ